MNDAPNWSDDDTEQEERGKFAKAERNKPGTAEREADEDTERAREAAKREEVDPDSEPDDG